MELGALTVEDFRPLLRQTFQLRLSDGRMVALSLIKVHLLPLPPFRTPWAEGEEVGRQPFLIWFRGPVGTVLPQQMFDLWHAELGEIQGLFLSPIGIDRNGRYYEAVFN